MKDLSVKRRSKLRAKEAKEILAWMEEEWGVVLPPEPEVESGFLDGRRVFIMGGRLVGVEEEGGFLLTVHGILLLKPAKGWVTVDMGAVRFIANGADVMSPGRVGACDMIEKGDLVWVRDEKNLRPLSVGRALMSGSEMVASETGKAIRTLHYVGDDIWNAEL